MSELVTFLESNAMWVFIVQVLTIPTVGLWRWKIGVVYGFLSITFWMGLFVFLFGALGH